MPILRSDPGNGNSKWDADVAAIIARRVSLGETLRQVCRTKGMPDESTVRLWAINDVCGFGRVFAQARELQAHSMAEDAIDEAVSAVDNQDAPAARLRFDAKKWFAGKMLPKTYGDSARLEVDAKVDLTARREDFATKITRLALAHEGGK
jgi:hypothetical protein